MRPLIAYLLLLPLSLPCLLKAQQRATWFENFGMEIGLSHPNVVALYRDSRGFLWIGTSGGGLNRYDGCEMKVYRHRDYDSLSLCHDHIVSILEDSAGYLWVGTDGGISRFNPANGRCQNFTVKNTKLFENYKNYLFKDPQGHIWTSNVKGIERFDSLTQRFIQLPGCDSAQISNYSAFDASGRLWGGGENGLKLINPTAGKFKRYLAYPDAPSAQYFNLNNVGVKIDRCNNIWSGTWGGGLLRFHPDSKVFEKFIWVPNPEFPEYRNCPFDIAETFDFEGKRIFWIATEDGVFRFSLAAQEFPSLKKPHGFFDGQSEAGLENGHPSVLLSDQEGNLWGGSGGSGIFRYNARQENFQAIKKVKEGGIARLTFAKNGAILVCGTADPLVILDTKFRRKKIFHRFSAKMHPSESRISWDVAKDEASGIVYIATFDGLVAYNDKTGKTRWYRYEPTDSSGLLWRKLTNILPLGDDKLLLGLWKHPLQLFDASSGKSLKVFKVNGIVRQIKKTADGRIWVCAEHQLLSFDSKKEEPTDITPTNDWVYWDVFSDALGRTWLATNEGLCLYDVSSKQVLAKYGVEEGLPTKNITRICGDKLGRLWLLSQLGVCYFDPKTNRCHTLNRIDGLVFGKVAAQMGQAPDGRIWLAYGDNIQIFQPELVKTPNPSRVYITGLKVNEQDTLPELPFEQLSEMRLQPGENTLTFSYTAIDLESFGKTNFLYLLEGLQTAWVRAGKSRVATFVNLPAGEYVFRVRPEDAGEDASMDATLRVIITNHYWQRAWFNYMMLLLILGSFFGTMAYFYRSQLRIEQAESKRREAIEVTRSQIAQDIHDDLGTDLSKISMGASLAAMIPDLDRDALREKLRSIGSEAQEVAQHLRDVVFIINPRFDTFSEVQSYYREKSRAFLESVGLEPHFDFPKTKHNPRVPPEVKRQLFLLLRECLNNIAKHAQATEVFISFRSEVGASRADRLKFSEMPLPETPYMLEIRDNGQGFDLEHTHHFSSGLKSMAKRAEKIGANLEINSALGHGTIIRLSGGL